MNNGICGPDSSPNIVDKNYFISFSDGFTRFTIFYLIKHGLGLPCMLDLHHSLLLVHQSAAKLKYASPFRAQYGRCLILSDYMSQSNNVIKLMKQCTLPHMDHLRHASELLHAYTSLIWMNQNTVETPPDSKISYTN